MNRDGDVGRWDLGHVVGALLKTRRVDVVLLTIDRVTDIPRLIQRRAHRTLS